MEALIILLVVAAIAVVVLKGFDRVAGRGPKQVSDGIEAAGRRKSPAEELQAATAQRQAEGPPEAATDQPQRVPCPECAERIMPAARKCRFCGAQFADNAGQ